MSLIDRYRAYNQAYRLGEFAPQPKRKPPAGPVGPPKPPSTSFWMNEIRGLSLPKRSEEEWDALLAARTKPFQEGLDRWYATAMGGSEAKFEAGKQANENLAAVFMREITGGRQGEEALRYVKEQFGSTNLPGQLAALGVQQLGRLTRDWDERDWQLSSAYLEKMAEIPALRERIREQVEAKDLSEYERRFLKATTIMGELWNAYKAKADSYFEMRNQGRQDKSLKVTQGQLQLETAKTAQDYAIAMTNITGFVYKPNRKNPSEPIRTSEPAPGSTAGQEAAQTARTVIGEEGANARARAEADAEAAEDAAREAEERAETRRKAVSSKEDAFASARNEIYEEVSRLSRVPRLEDLSVDQQYEVKYGGKKLEDFATKPSYEKAYNLLWGQYGESLLRYSSQRGRANLTKRVKAMIDKALASVGIVPPKKPEKRSGR